MTPEEYEDLLMTIAGEIDASKSPYGTARNRAEIAQIAQVIKNRALSRGGDMSDQIRAPSQFSYRFVDKGMDHARGNLAQYGDEIRSAVNDWEWGLNEAPLPTADHYLNPSIVNTSGKHWFNNLRDVGQIGPHAFGTDPAAMGRIQAGQMDELAEQRGGYPEPFERETALAGGYPDTQVAEAEPGFMDYLSSMFVTPAHAAEQPWVSGVDRAPAVTRGGRLPENREVEPFMLQPGMLAEPLPPAEVVPAVPEVYQAPFNPNVDIEDRPMVGAPMVQDFDTGGASDTDYVKTLGAAYSQPSNGASDYTPPPQSQREQAIPQPSAFGTMLRGGAVGEASAARHAASQGKQPPINPGMMAPINSLLQASLGTPSGQVFGSFGLMNNVFPPAPQTAFPPAPINQNSGLYSSLMQNSPQFASAMSSGIPGLF
jgi:hypothetical protein